MWLVGLGLAACGARTGLSVAGDDADAGDAVDASTNHDPDGGVVESCEVWWGACSVRTEAFQISEDHGQSPDLAWDGRELLVVYDAQDGGNVLAHVRLDGTVRGRVALGGIQQPRVTWNPVLRSGLVVVDSGVQWLGNDGWPVGEYVRAPIDGWQLSGDVSATATGFLLLTGTNAYGAPPPLYYAVLGAAPMELSFNLLAQGGPRAPAVHANGPDGLARWAASTTYYDAVGAVYRVGDQYYPPEVAYEIDDLLPLEGNGFVSAIAEHEGVIYLLYEGAPGSEPSPWTQWMLELHPEGPARTWQIDRSPNGGAGDLLSFGDTLVIASPAIHPDHRVSLAAFRPDVDPPIGNLWVVATDGFTVSHSARLTPTPTGLAVVWTEGREAFDGLVVMLEVLDCCPRE